MSDWLLDWELQSRDVLKGLFLHVLAHLWQIMHFPAFMIDEWFATYHTDMNLKSITAWKV